MAQFKIPGQNLTFDIPNEGEVFINPSDSWGSAIFIRRGNNIQQVNFQELGNKANPQLGGAQAISLGKQIFQQQSGINPDTIKAGYNMGDVMTAIRQMGGSFTPANDFSVFKSTPKNQNEVITQTNSPLNPNAPDVRSNITGDIAINKNTAEQNQARALALNNDPFASTQFQGGAPQASRNLNGQYSFQELPSGNVEIYENGKPVSSGVGFAPSYAQQLGYSPQATSGGANNAPQVQSGAQDQGLGSFQPLYDALKAQLDELQKRGQILNPNIEITPEKVAEFTSQAEREINPYYQGQLKMARESLLSSTNYATDELQRNESIAERGYGTSLRTLGESAADMGFAQSGLRQRDERELAQTTQETLGANRRKLAFEAGNVGRTFAQQYGTAQLPQSTIGGAPRVLAGQGSFSRESTPSSLYQLSPEIYSGLTGEQEFNRIGAVRNRASELEGAFRSNQSLNQLRQLTI